MSSDGINVVGQDAQMKEAIFRIAEVAQVISWQAGVGASETAGLIVSYLCAHPEDIPRFMDEGVELFIDGSIKPQNGALCWHAINGRIVTPAELRAELGGRDQ